MGVKLVSSSAGSVEIVAPATASNFTATMPAGTGTVAVQGASGVLVSGTAVASTSGASIDFTSIPSWVKRITVMFNGVSTSGTSIPLFQVGTGGTPTTSGYLGASSSVDAATASTTNLTTGFGCNSASAASVIHGAIIITNITGNTWVANGTFSKSNAASTIPTAGSVALAGTLNMVRITTVNGTDTFDAGTINILYE